MIHKREWRWALGWAVALVAVAALPYVVAYLATPDGLFYTGFLSNPEDGHTYLAKMRQGWRGEWRFHIAHTPEPHRGEFLYVYYLLLGHIARWTHLPLILVLQVARVINGLLLLLVLYYAMSWVFQDVPQRRFAFLITALGSGLGWLAMFAGGMTVDLWVPEGYVFYSVLANAHFPLAMAAMILALVWSVTPWGTRRIDRRRLIGVALCTVILGLVQPFCLLTVGVVLLVYVLLRWARERRLPRREIVSGIVFGGVGLPLGGYGYLAMTRNPVFATWLAQNQTLSPPPWDYAIGYGFVLFLALIGAWYAVRRRRASDTFVVCWAVSTLVLIYLPYSLQRRLVMGWIVPLGALATVGWYALPLRRRVKEGWVWGAVSLSYLFLIGMFVAMALAGHEMLYITRDERAALQWLADAVPQDALVMAAPETGLYIPAWAGQRVLYGHRFETADADLRKRQVEAFFANGDLGALPYRPDYVFCGAREQALQAGSWQPDARWKTVYRQGTVTIYAVPGD
jgi:hypothetical protein